MRKARRRCPEDEDEFEDDYELKFSLTPLSGELPNADLGIRVYCLPFRRKPLMKATRRDDVLFGSERVRRRKSIPEASEGSLFSLLLEIESRSRSGSNEDSKQGLRRSRSSQKEEQKQLPRRNLSRYVE